MVKPEEIEKKNSVLRLRGNYFYYIKKKHTKDIRTEQGKKVTT